MAGRLEAPSASRTSSSSSLAGSSSSGDSLAEALRGYAANLRGDLGVHLRYEAAEMLGLCGPAAICAAPALQKAMLTDPSVHVRKSAARALGSCGADATIGTIEGLCAVARDDTNSFVREFARASLTQIRYHSI